MRRQLICVIVVAHMQQDPIVPSASGPANAGNQPTPEEKKARRRNILSTIAILIAAPTVALLLTSFVFHPYQVDGASMETTLQDHDRLIVWKTPKTISKITRHPYVPARGDVIVFVKPEVDEFGLGENRQLIKRVVGLPGDRVVIEGGSITIYNKEHPDGFNPDNEHEFASKIITPTPGRVDLVVPENEVFVCGDNRSNSLDSRSFGTVSVDHIIGKLIFRIFPINKFKDYL